MNKNLKLFFFLVFILFAIQASSFSQNRGGWIGTKCKIDLPKGFSAGLAEEFRMYTPGITLDQILTDFELGYKINKRFDISLNYRYARKREKTTYLYPRNRWYFDVSYDNDIKRLKFENRIRVQKQTKSYWEDAWDKVPSYYFREKVKLSYNLKNTKKEPYLAFELFYPLNDPKTKFVDAYRLTLGTEIPLNKKQEIDIGFMFEKEFLPIYATFFNLLFTYSFEVN